MGAVKPAPLMGVTEAMTVPDWPTFKVSVAGEMEI